MEKKSQHYIPQTYLNEFSDTTIIKENWTPAVHIFYWKKQNEIVYLKQKSPKKICEETNYYSLNDADEDERTFLENLFQLSESNYSKILMKIKNEQELELTFEEKSQLSEFISFMFFRVPLKEEAIKQFVVDINEIRMDLAASTKDRFINEMRSLNLAMDKSDDELENIRQLYRKKNFKMTVNKGFINVLRFTACEEVAECVYYMKWDILIAPEGIDFITNDNPVCLFDPNKKGHPGFRSSKTVEMYFPLTPKYCLRGSYLGDNTTIKKKDVSDIEVKRINSLVLQHSYKYIFSSKSVIKWTNGESGNK